MHTPLSTKGFSLLELMVVIAIIGVLSSVVIVGLGNSRARARDAERISDISQLQLVLEQYYNACRQYPSATSTATNNGCPGSVTLGTFVTPWPSGGYGYQSLSSNSTYLLQATLETRDSVLNEDIDDANRPSGGSLSCNDSATSTPFYYCVVP